MQKGSSYGVFESPYYGLSWEDDAPDGSEGGAVSAAAVLVLKKK